MNVRQRYVRQLDAQWTATLSFTANRFSTTPVAANFFNGLAREWSFARLL